jgi:hypothetical protein
MTAAPSMLEAGRVLSSLGGVLVAVRDKAGGSAVASVFSHRTRLDASPSSGESMYAFLDRVAGPFWDRIRQLIEDWVNDYCRDDQAEMMRLHNKSDIDFTAAYWELLLYHGLKALGFEVTCHPKIGGTTRRPDFLVENEECSFYLEAKVLGEDAADRSRDKARNDIYHALNARVNSDDFFVWIQFNQEGPRPIPIRRLADATQAWLDGLGPAQVRRQTQAAGPLGATPHVWEDQPSGRAVALVPILKSSSGGGHIVGLMGGGASWIDDRTPIRKALDQKAHRYGNELDRPFVVALGVLRAFADDTDVMDALFGNEVYSFDPSTGVGSSARKPDGLLIGPDGPRSRRLSAVLVGAYVAPWLSAATELKLWKNPWAATFPLDCGAGGAATTIELQDNGSLAATAAIMSTGELFGLPQDWPGPEPAFPRT